MVLSKDNIDGIEEINTELTAAQKRRLRRKKLKEARSGSLNTEKNIQKDSVGVKKHPNNNIANEQKQLPNKKQKHKSDSQVLNKTGNSISEETTLKNQKLKCEDPSVCNVLGATTKSAVSKDFKNQESNGDYNLITNNNIIQKFENSLIITEVIPESVLNVKEEQEDTLNSNTENPENVSIIENNRNTSESLHGEYQKEIHEPTLKPIQELLSQCFCPDVKDKPELIWLPDTTDLLGVTDLALISEQTVESFKIDIQNTDIENYKSESQSFYTDIQHNPELKDLNERTHLPSVKDLALIRKQTVDSFTIDTQSTSLVNSKSEHPELKSQNLEPIETELLDCLSMGKLKDTKESQKQDGTVKTELIKEDSSSTDAAAKSREEIKAAREAKKLAKQKAKKKDDNQSEDIDVKSKSNVQVTQVKDNVAKTHEVSVSKTEKTKTIGSVADTKSKENIPPTDKKKADDNVKKDLGEKSTDGDKIETTTAKPEEGKSKAELRAERRAKQEAQRAAKQETQRAAKPVAEQKPAAPEVKDKEPVKSKEEKVPKAKSAEKVKPKTQMQKVGWFQHLYVEKDKEPLTNIPINSNLHPAVVKLAVQLAERVVTGSNARCIALLDAIKKMVRDYSVPARTEFGRGLQAQLAAAADFLWARRAATAAETNALKHVRRHLTQLPANVDEFDAKKLLQAEIDRYIREQIDMAGEAISLILRKKISPGDHILTYGCSSLIERALCSAWTEGVSFRATVAGARGGRGPEMLRRLRARGVPATYVDISALSHVMNDVQKVVLGASALLANGAALGAAGSAQAALLARARNVPVLVACETHKFSERTNLDPLVTNEIGDPDELIDKTDPSSPLRDWRSNPRLTLLNVTYDVTPPGLITAVVTDLGILPCTSAPVVLRFKQAEYGM